MVFSTRAAACIVVALQLSAAFFVLCALTSMPEVAANVRHDCRGFEAAISVVTLGLAHYWIVPFGIFVLVGHALPIAVIARAGFIRALPIQALAFTMELTVIGAIWLALVSHFVLLRLGHNCF